MGIGEGRGGIAYFVLNWLVATLGRQVLRQAVEGGSHDGYWIERVWMGSRSWRER